MQHTTFDASSSAATVDHPVQTSDGRGNPERLALKRAYLTLLPHTQLVELCLAFEAYSPPHVKSSLWPPNLAAAVAELQSGPPPPPSSQKDIRSKNPVADVPLTSVSSPPDAIIRSLSTGVLDTGTAIDPRLPSDNSNGHATTTSTGDDLSSPQQPRTYDEASWPTSQSASSTKAELPQGSHPHASYGYPPTQYPHTPYYPPLNLPHSFPPQPPTPYPHAAFSPSHPHLGSGPLFPGIPHHPHATTDHSGMPADDLPSYEDMLVEALTDLNESEGSAPKSLFTWMASRYPLHTNFRPSASQALQKAFKRGRLEKGSNNRYRLNASWDGGSTSRRTTRRPQSFVHMALPMSHGPPATSPFTHAPLSQPGRGPLAHNASTPTSLQEKTLQYGHSPYHYPGGAGYPRYESSVPPPVPKEISAEPPVSDEVALVERNAVDEEVGEGSDAWEAAQAILKAINFGSLLQTATAKPAAPPHRQPSPAANSVHVGSGSDGAAAGEKMTSAAPAGQVQSLSDRDRASLQAQLALLAAQLAEIAEDTLASDLNIPDQDEEGDGMVGEDDDMEAVDISP